jgi:hypothetical protein
VSQILDDSVPDMPDISGNARRLERRPEDDPDAKPFKLGAAFLCMTCRFLRQVVSRA